MKKNMQQEQEKASIIEENKDDAVLDSLLVREMVFTTPLSIARMHPVVDLPPLPDKFIPSAKGLREKDFRDKVSGNTKQMMEHLTVGEQLRVSFVPLIITHIAWHYAEKAMECAARDKVSILKKLSRVLKMARKKYEDDLRRDLDNAHIRHIAQQAEMCMEKIQRDLTILYFSVSQEFKRTTPDYPYDELRTYAIMSMMFIELLEQHNKEMDKLLEEKLHDKTLASSILPPVVSSLHTGMAAFYGVEGKFNYEEQNVALAMKVIKNRIDSIEFSVFDK